MRTLVFALSLVCSVCLAGAGCSSAPMYAPCDDSGDCGGAADGCYRLLFDRSDGTQGDGTMCTKRCVGDADCPGAGVCLALAGDPDRTFVCFESCVADRCFDPHACTPVDGTDTDICLP